MKLRKIISNINQVEISKFYNILTSIINEINNGVSLSKDTDAEHFVDTFNKIEINSQYKKVITKI